MRVARPLAAGVLVAASVALVLTGSHQPTEQGPMVAVLVGAIAAVLAGLIVSLAVLRPWWGLLAWLVASPLINVARAELWIGEIQLIPSTLLIAALGTGVVLDRIRSGAVTPRSTSRTMWILLGVGATLAIASSLAAPAPGEAANITLHGVLEPMAVFAIAAIIRPDARQALHALVALAAGVALATAINLAWLFVVVAPADLYAQRMQLARLTYFNVGIFASMLVIAIPGAVGLLLLDGAWRRGRAVRVLAWLAIGLFGVALYLTYTKSASLSAAAVCAILIVVLVPGWRARLPLLLAVAALLAVVVPYPLPVLRATVPDAAAAYESFLRGFQGSGRLESWDPDTYQGSGSIGIRLVAIGAAAEMAAESPLLGVGAGGFAREFPRVRPGADVPELQSAHNLLPNLAAEYGLPFALLVAVGLLYLVGITLISAHRAAGELRLAGTLLAVSLIGFLAMATLFGVDLYRSYRTMNSDVVAAALLAGLALSVATRHDRRSPGP